MNCPSCSRGNPDYASYCSHCGAPLESEQTATHGTRCYVHPRVETALRCGNCNRPICVQCVVQHPVGVRCKKCARSRKLPTFDVSPAYYARAIGAGMALAMASGLGIFLMTRLLHLSLFPALLALVAGGYLIGEGISLSVNRKRSRGLQYIAGGSVLATSLISGFPLTDIYGLLALVAAVYVAASRLRVP